MSALPYNTFASPGVSFYLTAGSQGAGSNIQSPVTVLPAVPGTVQISAIASQAAAGAELQLLSGANAPATILIGQSAGNQFDILSNNANGDFSIGSAVVTPGQTPVFQYNPDEGSLVLGDNQDVSGSGIAMNQPLSIGSFAAGANTLALGAASATQSLITQTVAQGGTVGIGSSVACPVVMAAVDTAGAGTSFVSVVNGGTNNLRLEGGAAAGFVNPSVTTSAADAGTLCLGSSATNPQTMFVTNTGGANNGFVDITGGTATGPAVRLRGYGVGTSATVSTNTALGVLNVSSGPADVSPAIVISPTALTLNRNQTVFAAPTVGSGAYGITQQIIASGGNIGTTAYALTNPALAGIYTIMVRVGDNAAVNINGQIDSVGYWDGNVWVAGAVNISPPLGTGNLLLWFGPTATARTTLLLQNTGSAALSGVAVYMIPQLIGLSSVIT